MVRELPGSGDFLDGVVSRLSLAPTVIEPGEFTRVQLSERTGQRASYLSRRLAKESEPGGTLTRRRGKVNGRDCWIYREVKP